MDNRDRELQTLKDTYRNKWVVNLSSKALTPSEHSLLAKGPKFAVAPDKVPVVDYIVSTESALKDISSQEADSVRHEVVKLLDKCKLPSFNHKD